jgi:hypothetical protein
MRVPSMSAGLEASTVAPGRTPPRLSRTLPAIALWAKADAGKSIKTRRSEIVPIHPILGMFDLLNRMETSRQFRAPTRRVGSAASASFPFLFLN